MAANPGAVNPAPNKWLNLLIMGMTNFLFWALTLFLVINVLPSAANWMHGQVPHDIQDITKFFNGGLVTIQVVAGALLILLFIYIGAVIAPVSIAHFTRLVAKEIFSVVLNTGSLLLAAAAIDPVHNGAGAWYSLISYFAAVLLWVVL